METGGGSCVTPNAEDYHGLQVAIETAIVGGRVSTYM